MPSIYAERASWEFAQVLDAEIIVCGTSVLLTDSSQQYQNDCQLTLVGNAGLRVEQDWGWFEVRDGKLSALTQA